MRDAAARVRVGSLAPRDATTATLAHPAMRGSRAPSRNDARAPSALPLGSTTGGEATRHSGDGAREGDARGFYGASRRVQRSGEKPSGPPAKVATAVRRASEGPTKTVAETSGYPSWLSSLAQK